ncbi:MAG: GvpL/GvpF family gas vesicle protein [Deltaproteobacteria bacterium]|nr:GvpL/GvpF family gas vesicle protein [Deltaproteobacteria bacterium]
MEDGNYLYCIIGTDEARNFGTIGIGGRGDIVSTIGYEGVSCVASRSPVADYAVSRENLLTHQKVIEEVMKDHTVLPVRFSTIAKSPEDIRGLLRKRHTEFIGLLKDMDNKIELGLKAVWKDMGTVFRDIAERHDEIKRLKERIGSGPKGKTYLDSITLGKMVESALQGKKEAAAELILFGLRDISFDIRVNKLHGDSMILNAAFLVDRVNAKEFDVRVQNLDRKKNGDMALRYVGPVPPFNFVNIAVEWN